MAFAKLSLGLLITSLMAEGFSLLASRGLLVIILGWALASIFALAFQCSVPHPWDFGGRCIDQVRANRELLRPLLTGSSRLLSIKQSPL